VESHTCVCCKLPISFTYKIEAILVTGRGGQQSRNPHYLDCWLTYGGEVVSLTHLPRPTPQRHSFTFLFGTHFCQRLSKSQGLVQPNLLGKFIKLIYLIGSETRDFLTYSVVPQSLFYRVPQSCKAVAIMRLLPLDHFGWEITRKIFACTGLTLLSCNVFL
jgi:hypothetical protein